MAKLPIDLSQFKKVSNDEHTTTMRHKDGHEFKVAHKALSPKMRGQLAAMKMADGGQVPKPKSSSGPYVDPKAAKEVEAGATQSGWQPEQWKKNIKEGLGLAHGGQVQSGAAASGWPASKENYEDEEMNSLSNNPKLEESKKLPRYADGGDVEKKKEDQPVTINIGGMPAVPQSAVNPNPGSGSNANNPQEMTPEQQKAANVSQPGVIDRIGNAILPNANGAQPPTPQTEAPQPDQPQLQSNNPAQNLQAVDQQVQQSSNPILEAQQKAFQGHANAANEQIAGLKGEAAAKGALGREQAAVETKHAKDEINLSQTYQKNIQDINSEVAAFQKDIANSHINPERYMGSMDTGRKISTTIGLILGGIGSGISGGPNQALQLLNKHIDNDIEAQKAELGKKHTLLSSYMEKYHNLQQATQMTKMSMAAAAAAQISAAAAKAQGPIEANRAMQAAGLIHQAMQPEIQKAALMQALQKGNNSKGGQSSIDPAQLVPSVVPKDRQVEVNKEIERAQNTKKSSKPILEAFDRASEDISGLGHITSLAKRPRSLNALHQLLATTVTDITGTARQAEFDAMERNLLPNSFDTPADIASKKKNIIDYLQAKSSAPTAKQYGIDLEKFQSTAPAQQNFSDKEQKYIEWAKKNPKSQIGASILKKYDIK